MNMERLSNETFLNSDGDVVPPDDVPSAEDLLENKEIIKNQFFGNMTEQAKYHEKFSDEYKEVVALIEAGLEKSRGYNHYKVEYGGKSIRLDIFLATRLFKIDLTNDERKAILDTYIPLAMTHEYAKHVAVAEEAKEAKPDDEFEAFYNLYDQIEANNPGGGAEIRELAKARALRLGISIPPNV